jgi:hypothetical protein
MLVIGAYAGVAWAAAPEVPVVSVQSPVRASEAVFEGVLNPKGTPSEGGTYQFVYRLSNKSQCKGSGELKSPEPAGLGLGAEDEVLPSETVTGLTPGTEYAVCLVAENLSGKTASAAVSFTTAITPEIPTGLDVKPLAATTATLNGTLNPAQGGDQGSYVFLYKHSSSECEGESQTTPTSATGAKEEPAQAEITGLSPHTEYTFCLQATNEAGETTTSAPVTFTTPAALPKIEEESVTEVADTSATLHASINPQGAPTSYRFEYAPRDGAFEPIKGPEGTGSVGEGDTGVPVEAHVQEGLEPGVSYEFRVVVENEVSKEAGHPVEGEPTDFNTQQAPGGFTLPDGRAYELVSPPQKQGALVGATASAITEAASDGDALTYQARLPTEVDPRGFNNQVQVISTREPSGWKTRDLTLPSLIPTGPQGGSTGPEHVLFSSDLSQAAIQPFGPFISCTSSGGAPQPCLSPDASEQTGFLDDLQDEAFTPLVTGCPLGEACSSSVGEHADVPPGTVFGGRQESNNGIECVVAEICGPRIVATTPDLGHIVLESDVGLTEGPGAAGGLYEWSAGKLTFIGAGEEEAEGESTRERGAFAAHGAYGISSDGSRVVFGGKSEGPTGEPLEGLLMRDTATGETVKLGEGQFQTASADDSRVFFDTAWETGQLDVWEQTSAPGEPITGTTTELTEGQGFRGLVLGASEDGSYVYFVSNGVLAGSGASSAGDNLYVDHYDAELGRWQPTFIAALSNGDFHDWDQETSGGWIAAFLQRQPSRVSPNGLWVTFMSEASLTGYDNRDAANPGRSDAEVYLYHAAASASTATLRCASCDPTGARPIGVEFQKIQEEGVAATFRAWPGSGFVAASLPGWRNTVEAPIPEGYQPRYLSNSGRLFFDSEDGLVPQDTNGTEDVYEFEPQGVPEGEHACSPSSSDGSGVFEPVRGFKVSGREGQEGAGCVALISSGDSSEESGFLDASEDGSDVFIVTTAKLSPQDKDNAYDVYDAHECTVTSLCLATSIAPPPCDTEASCKPSPTSQPEIYGVGPTETFSGPGNAAPSSPPSSKPASGETRPEKLAKALKRCRKDRAKGKRVSCEKVARRRYGAPPAKKSGAAERAGHGRVVGR